MMVWAMSWAGEWRAETFVFNEECLGATKELPVHKGQHTLNFAIMPLCKARLRVSPSRERSCVVRRVGNLDCRWRGYSAEPQMFPSDTSKLALFILLPTAGRDKTRQSIDNADMYIR